MTPRKTVEEARLPCEHAAKFYIRDGPGWCLACEYEEREQPKWKARHARAVELLGQAQCPGVCREHPCSWCIEVRELTDTATDDG